MPGATTVWYVPGFMGSEMYVRGFTPSGQPAPLRVLFWPPFSHLMHGRFWAALTYPTPPTFRVEVGQVIRPMGYSPCLSYLDSPSIRPAACTLREWPYDWRLPVDTLGSMLATEIRLSGGAPGSHGLFGHSLGAAIIMSAWKWLKRDHAENLVSRVVTLGGLLWGSYSTANTWLEYEDSMNLFAWIPTLMRSLSFATAFGVRPNNNRFEISRTILETFTSWPATYDLLADPGRGDDYPDVWRPILWDPSSWRYALVPPDPAQLTRAAAYHADAHNPENWPPPDVLAHIVGTTRGTPYRAMPPVLTNDPGVDVRQPHVSFIGLRRALCPGYVQTSEGDNRATVQQQSVPGRVQWHIHGEHAEIQNHPFVLENFWPIMTGTLPEAQAPIEVPLPLGFPTREEQARRTAQLQGDPSLHIPPLPTAAQIYAARKAYLQTKQVKQTIRDPGAVHYDAQGRVITR